MKIRLFHKFFGLVFVSVVLSLLTAAVTIGYFGQKNFHRYLENRMAEEFASMAENLGRYYEVYGSFDPLRNDMNAMHSAFRGSRRDPGREGPKFPEPPPKKEIFTILGENREYLAGGHNRPEDMHLFPVRADGGLVGYLGVVKRENLRDTFAENFLKRQSYLLVITSVLVTIFSSLAALWLTRSILRPINKLNTATEKVAARDFDVHINVGTKDELADLADNFQKMVETLREYEQKQTRWISDISHELRTPLSVLLGSMEAVQDGVRKADSETLELMYRQAVRVKKLVNELHDISLAESGAMHLQKARADIVNELAGMLDFYEVRMAEAGFRVETSFAATADKFVNVDLMRINQVFINILENTVKYAKSPGVLYVSCKTEKGQITVVFEDTGPGVAEEHLPFLFDRLYRVDSSRSRSTGGSGLGLSICRFIIENHGGEIYAEKSDKGGLRIVIKLPQEL